MLFVAYASNALYEYIAVFFDTIFSGILTLIFIHALQPLLKRNKLINMGKETIFCILILIAGVIAGTSYINVAGILLRGVFSSFIILLFAWAGGVGLGASAGVLVGIIPGVFQH